MRDVQKIEVAMSNERQLAEVRFLTVAEVASIMRVSKMTVYRMVHAGRAPRHPCGPFLPRSRGRRAQVPAHLVRRHRVIAC